jgi:hypothetical protein
MSAILLHNLAVNLNRHGLILLVFFESFRHGLEGPSLMREASLEDLHITNMACDICAYLAPNMQSGCSLIYVRMAQYQRWLPTWFPQRLTTSCLGAATMRNSNVFSRLFQIALSDGESRRVWIDSRYL